MKNMVHPGSSCLREVPDRDIKRKEALNEDAQLIFGQKVDFAFKADFRIGTKRTSSDFANHHEVVPARTSAPTSSGGPILAELRAGQTEKHAYFLGFSDRNFPDEPEKGGTG